MTDSLISVIIPVYNGERFIQEAIRSILNQGYHPIEILVVDDGSTDDTKMRVLDFGKQIKYLYQKNQGPGAARNSGLKYAKGNLIGFLDCDDLWPEGRLDLLLQKYKEDPFLEIVMGHIRSEPVQDSIKVPEKLLNPHVMPLFGSGLFKKSVFKKVGLIDVSLRYSEDQDWFLRAKEKGVSISILTEIVLIRRIHSDNMTDGADWKEVNILKVLKKSIDRRRKENQGEVRELPKLSDFKKD
jgi:glycosyltransferase involved in cell wall biosynthesis